MVCFWRIFQNVTNFEAEKKLKRKEKKTLGNSVTAGDERRLKGRKEFISYRISM